MGVKIFAGRATQTLGSNIASCYGVALGDVKVTKF
jgi:hypothetical protein